MTLKELLEKRAGLVVEARGILEKAEKESRSMTDEESQNYERIMKDVGDLKQRCDRMTQLEAEERSLSELEREPAGDASPEQREANNDPRGTAEYRSAYDRYLRANNAQVAVESRATLQVASNQGGGQLVPTQTLQTIITALDNAVHLRQLATIHSIPEAASLGCPTEEEAPDEGDWTPEIAQVTADASMAFGKRELTPKLNSKLLKLSQKLVRMLPNLPAYVQSRLAYKQGVALENAYMTGDGNGKPLGLFMPSAQGIPGTSAYDIATGNDATNVTFDGLINAKGSLPSQYRRSPKFRFLGHRDLFTRISKLKDGEGRYIWLPSVVASEPDRVLGVPIIESEYAPNTFTANQYVGMFGDFSYYWIADSMQMSIQNLVETFALTNQIAYILRLETDGMPVLPAAFRRVKLGA